MAGCRPLTDAEVELVSRSFGGRYAVRDKALFLLGVYTGFRISELLSIRVGDVWHQGTMRHVLRVARQHMKGQREGRVAALNEKVRVVLAQWIAAMPQPYDAQTPLFRSQKGGKLGRGQAWKILRDAYAANDLEGPLGSHTMRKTTARRLYDQTQNVLLIQRALGHQHLGTTEKYLGFILDEQVFAAQRAL